LGRPVTFGHASRFAGKVVIGIALSTTFPFGITGEQIMDMQSLAQSIDAAFGEMANAMTGVLFYDFGIGIPFVVLWLILGALFFTLCMRFINLRGFRHALRVTRGRL
jgi:hypothetical protein